MSRDRRPSSPSNLGLCIDDREHSVEDFYDQEECWACGLPLEAYWLWYMHEGGGTVEVGELAEDDSAAASIGFVKPVALPVGKVERWYE